MKQVLPHRLQVFLDETGHNAWRCKCGRMNLVRATREEARGRFNLHVREAWDEAGVIA